MKIFLFAIYLMLSMTLISGCSSFGRTMKSWVGGDPHPEPANTGGSRTTSTENSNLGTSYNQRQNMPVYTDKNYQKMSKEDFENEYLAKDRDGSLWVMEGQDSYLFSQNIVRLPGDIFNVVLDGQPQKQLSTKVNVIKDLSEAAKRKPAAVVPQGPPPGIPILDGGEKTAAAPAMDANAPAQPAQQAAKTDPRLDQFDVSQIPVRIVDRTIDGSYRVKGSQIFMIGKDEYKVIVSGLVRPNDVADGGVSSSKMIDSKFDIVRSRKRTSL